MAARWFGGEPSQLQTADDAENRFQLKYELTEASIQWSASNANGFRYVSDPSAPQATVFAAIGRERNGSFYAG